MKDQTVYLKTEDIANGFGIDSEEMKELLLNVQADFWFTRAGFREIEKMIEAEQLSEFVFSLFARRVNDGKQMEFYLKTVFETIPTMRAEMRKPSMTKVNGEPRALTTQQRRAIEKKKRKEELRKEFSEYTGKV